MKLQPFYYRNAQLTIINDSSLGVMITNGENQRLIEFPDLTTFPILTNEECRQARLLKQLKVKSSQALVSNTKEIGKGNKRDDQDKVKPIAKSKADKIGKGKATDKATSKDKQIGEGVANKKANAVGDCKGKGNRRKK